MNNTVTAQQTKWGVDPAHSEITFKVRHMMIASVTGQFESFTAIAETNGDSMEGAHFSFSADVASVNTHAFAFAPTRLIPRVQASRAG